MFHCPSLRLQCDRGAAELRIQHRCLPLLTTGAQFTDLAHFFRGYLSLHEMAPQTFQG